MNRASFLLAGCLLLLTSGCYTTTIRNGMPPAAPSVAHDGRWHHGVIWGIAEISGPYSLDEICPNGWAEVTTETSFLNGLLDAITSGIYSPQSVTVRCSATGATPAEAAAPSEAPAAVPAEAPAAVPAEDLPPPPPPS